MLVTVNFGTVNTGASVYYRILNADKTVYVARTNAGVSELVAGSGLFGINILDADLAGRSIIWDIDGTCKTASESFPPADLVAITTMLTDLHDTHIPAISTIVTFLRKAVRNKLTVDIPTQEQILYDDDGITPLVTQTVTGDGTFATRGAAQ